MFNRKKGEKVSIVKCSNYRQKNVDDAIINALALADIKIPKGKKVLIKPNLVKGDVKNLIATITHYSLIEAICKILKKNNCKIYIGESSFMDTEDAFKKSKIDKIAKKYGKLIIFEQDKLVKIKNSNLKILKSFYLSKILKNMDLIINVPKLKTHQLTRYTGAVKNLYGCIPGGMKQKLHRKATNEKKFSKLLIDIYQNIKPEINIMDAIIGMEGNGPTSGISKKAGYILASKNAITLDVVSSKLMGYNPKEILTNKEAIKRKFGTFKFQLIGLKKLPNLRFKKPVGMGNFAKSLTTRFRYRPIIVDENKCTKCGICAKKCPVNAITLKPFPVIDKKKCIRCFCCIEVCPKGALSLKE
jgi:uncharacterized protein (DUF362 family)